ILCDDLLVLEDRLVVLLFLDELLGGHEHLFAVNRHGEALQNFGSGWTNGEPVVTAAASDPSKQDGSTMGTARNAGLDPENSAVIDGLHRSRSRDFPPR